MGGGVSSLSKICIIGPPSRPDADVDYTFAQISIKEATVDYRRQLREHELGDRAVRGRRGAGAAAGREDAVVRIHNTNTSKIIVSRFKVRDGQAVTEGDLRIDGVAGTAAPIRLEFTDPGGTKTRACCPPAIASTGWRSRASA